MTPWQARCAKEAEAETAQAEALLAKAEALTRQAHDLPFGQEREAFIYRAGLLQAEADHHHEEARVWREGAKR